MTEHKRTNNNHCKSKKRNWFQTDSVVSGVLTLFVVVVVVVVVSTKSILEILLAHVGSFLRKLGGIQTVNKKGGYGIICLFVC
mgnify:CR=1 FL=1